MRLLLAHYTVVNKTSRILLPATTTVAGIITLATQAEVNAGVDANKAVTPVTLQAKQFIWITDCN
jgi:hypothetical protein